MTTHVDRQLLERLRARTLTAEDRQLLRGHLSERCPGCSHAVARVLVEREPEIPRPVVVRPGDLLRRHLMGQGPDAELEELVAPGLAAVLEAFEEAEAFQLIAEERAYQTMALATCLTEESHRQAIPDMVRAYHLARRAIAVAAQVGSARYGQAIHFDLQGEAALALANASRCRSRFYEARRMMALATSLLSQGTGDVERHIRLASLQAPLCSDLGYERDALRWLDEARRLSRFHGVGLGRKKYLVKKGAILCLFEPARGAKLNRRLVQMLDCEQEPWLYFCALTNLALSLGDSGRPHEALNILRRCDHSRCAAAGARRTFSEWMKARVYWKVGQVSLSLALFAKVRREFTARGLIGELGTLNVEVGELYLAQGRESLARRCISEACELYSLNGSDHRARMARALLKTH